METTIEINREFFANVPVPAQTKTYVPVTHTSLINAVLEQLDKANMHVKREYYSQNRNGQQMFGHFTVSVGDSEQDMNIGFRNSYDKSMQLGLVSGNRVIVCSNLMFKGDFKVSKMHYGNIAEEIDGLAHDAVASMEQNFLRIKHDSERMKQVEIDRRIIAEILGDLFMYENLLTTTQLAIIKGELELKQNFGDGTLWDIYNHTTEALKRTPVTSLVQSHIAAHQYYTQRAELVLA